MAQRVMDCGDAGHILLSKHVAEDLEQYPQWRPYLHDLGECEVKHGVARRRGQSLLTMRTLVIRSCRESSRRLKKHRSPMCVGRAVGDRAAGGGRARRCGSLLFCAKRPARSLATAVEKSIAVLPFENLSEEKANAFFTEGVQDEILTDLAQIADLESDQPHERHAVQERRAAQSARDRSATRRGTCRRRQCAARGQQSAGERAVDRCPQRRASVGANLRSRSGRCLRHPKRNRQGDCRSVAGEALA